MTNLESDFWKESIEHGRSTPEDVKERVKESSESPFWQEMIDRKQAVIDAEEQQVKEDAETVLSQAAKNAYAEADTVPGTNREPMTDKELEAADNEVTAQMPMPAAETDFDAKTDPFISSSESSMGELIQLDDARKDEIREELMDDDDSELSPDLLEAKQSLLETAEALKLDPELAHIQELQELSAEEIAKAFLDEDNKVSDVISEKVLKVTGEVPAEKLVNLNEQIAKQMVGDPPKSLARMNRRIESVIAAAASEVVDFFDGDEESESYEDAPTVELTSEAREALIYDTVATVEDPELAAAQKLFLGKAEALKQASGSDASLDAVKAALLAGAGAAAASELLQGMEEKAPAAATEAKQAVVLLEQKAANRYASETWGPKTDQLGMFGKAGLIMGGIGLAGASAFVGRLFRGWREGLAKWLPASWGDRLKKGADRTRLTTAKKVQPKKTNEKKKAA